ncbi:MAG: hypothetical protein OXC41_04280 [Gammaproteobacteria bacterium]|nr:hypothetical protein [Gammaproteobacteria bacterium]
MDYQWHDVIGNIGVALIIITYLLLQLGRMGSASYTYSILNALGAFFVIISLMYDFNMSVFIIDVVWIGVSVFGIIRQWRTNH